MSRKSKKCKQRALNLESNEDTVISNFAANDDNSTPMESLRVLQEMFANRLDPDLIHDVFQECAGNADQTLNNLFEICGQQSNEESLPSLPTHPFTSSDHTITEVPHIVSEPPLQESTNPNTEYLTNSTINEPNVQVLNLLPINAKTSSHKSPLNAVMPFANLFAPKPNNCANSFVKSSHSSKPKEFGLKDEIKQMIRMSDQKVLILMRGLPGSGKTTLANYLVYGTNGIILSTDDYFINNGVYRFDSTQLHVAHDWNQRRAKKYIESGKTPVVIDNTNLEGWEMKPYVSYGYSNGYKIYFIEPDTQWARNPKELSKRNIHGIPKEKLELMVQKFERLTVEDILKSFPTNSHHLLQKSNSEEKVNKSKVSTNASKHIILRSRSNPSNPETSICAQIEAMKTDPQIESSSSTNSTEPTSPVTDTQIDMDLLLALNQSQVDSEDCSSINASDGGSSCVSQESGWERDDEFTYAHNHSQQTSATDCDNDFNICDNTVDDSETDPKPQKEQKQKNAIISEDCIIEDIEEEARDQLNDDILPKAECSSNSTRQEPSSSTNNNNNRRFGLVGVPKPNWEIPPFPIEANNKASNTSEISITFYSRHTQTERKDWALLELKQSNDVSNEGLETVNVDKEENPIETKVEAKRNESKVRLHKGTFTIDMPDHMTRDQKLDTLRQKFPKAENNHLNEILDACLEDDIWAEKLLSELNDNHFDVGSLEQLSIGVEPIASSPEIDSESNSTEDEEPLELLVNRKNSEEPEFSLILDPSLAAQLQSHFGALTDSSSAGDLTITLSHGVARLLHHNWKKSLNQKPLNRNSTKPQSIEDFVKHKELNRKPKPKPVCPQLCPKSELQEIMDLEMAKELSRKEYTDSLAANAINALCPTKRQNAKELLSTKLKRDQLYQRYPGVDTTFLESIFESNDCYLGKTINVLDNSLGLNDDFSTETETLIAQEHGSHNGSVNGSRSTSPVKSIRKTVDINTTLQQMNELLEKKKEFHDKARLAFQRKMFAVASYYGDEAMQLQFRIDRQSKDIVDALLTNSTNSNELDLHGLHVPEVNAVLAEFLRRKSDELMRSIGKRKLLIDIITGYGATKGVQGRIKPLVIQYLKQKNFTYEMVNMGVIRVTLTQQS